MRCDLWWEIIGFFLVGQQASSMLCHCLPWLSSSAFALRVLTCNYGRKGTEETSPPNLILLLLLSFQKRKTNCEVSFHLYIRKNRLGRGFQFLSHHFCLQTPEQQDKETWGGGENIHYPIFYELNHFFLAKFLAKFGIEKYDFDPYKLQGLPLK